MPLPWERRRDEREMLVRVLDGIAKACAETDQMTQRAIMEDIRLQLGGALLATLPRRWHMQVHQALDGQWQPTHTWQARAG